ncbi:hypothetical protein [Bacillus sp. FSL K6-3431]|uniref:hypothetical protein n=1 Tax=Bacillus sp. FSL K6-3431 TaxID=2921500 RepID=UPI0030F75961
MTVLKNTEEIQQFLDILNDSEENPNFQLDTEKGDPDYYEMVFYTDEPIAVCFHCVQPN